MEKILLYLIIFLAVFLILNRYLRWWAKSAFVVFYTIVIYYFQKGYTKLNNDYEAYRSENGYNHNDAADVAMQENFWDMQTEHVAAYQGFLLIPALSLLIYSYYKWLQKAPSRTRRILIGTSIIPVSILYLFISLQVAMLGYQP
ncbi:hypothetical protein [Oceanobacillus massiliensis]|uniref:hypothetical protein n=1 Tax=Oceanobacillus massiliensis TaxID=1465765 RepID=UPI003016B2EE